MSKSVKAKQAPCTRPIDCELDQDPALYGRCADLHHTHGYQQKRMDKSKAKGPVVSLLLPIV